MLTGSSTLIVNLREALPYEFLAVTVKDDFPAFVGVPEIKPEELSVSPFGSVPDFVHVIGAVPEAVR